MPTSRLFLLLLGLVGRRSAEPPVATPNDHRTPAGKVDAGLVSVALEARAARWRPAADDGPALEIASVAVTLVNRLADTSE